MLPLLPLCFAPPDKHAQPSWSGARGCGGLAAASPARLPRPCTICSSRSPVLCIVLCSLLLLQPLPPQEISDSRACSGVIDCPGFALTPPSHPASPLGPALCCLDKGPHSTAATEDSIKAARSHEPWRGHWGGAGECQGGGCPLSDAPG